MSDILSSCIKFLQNKHPEAVVLHEERWFKFSEDGEKFKIWPLIAQDPSSGIKQRAIALFDLGKNSEVVSFITNNIDLIFNNGILIRAGNDIHPSGHAIDTTQMTFAAKIIIYTNKIHGEIRSILDTFALKNILIEIKKKNNENVAERNQSDQKVNSKTKAPIYHTLFISYGGPDENAAIKINNYLKAQGIKTWFFPDDGLPGQKLHRVMHEEINNHDRVLLLCSEQSLQRPGVLNELERTLEREAKEGGSDILIPITLDDYVYTDWAPHKQDIATQVRSRIITKIDINSFESIQTQKELEKLFQALSQK